MIHLDVWNTKTKSIGGCKYYVNFIDDHIKKVWVYFMKHKGEAFQLFFEFQNNGGEGEGCEHQMPKVQ